MKMRTCPLLLALCFDVVAVAGTTPAFVTLNVTPAATFGQQVVMTATVTAGATGKVTFFDGVSILGVRALTNSQAIFTTTLLPAGVRSLRAFYAGDATYQATASPVVPVTVQTVAAHGFREPQYLVPGASAAALAVGDLNNDGKPDIVTARRNQGGLSVFVGKGDGTFTSPVIPSADTVPIDMVIVDVDGDGNPDVVTANCSSDAPASVWLGDGNGGLRTPSTIAVPGGCQYGIAAGDFDRDGKADLAFSSPELIVQIFAGNGDGTFRAAAFYPIQSRGPLTVADLNNDGIADLVATEDPGGAVSVLLGRGDATFQYTGRYFTYGAGKPAIADFNQDGKLDIAVGSSQDFSKLKVFLGGGDGTFQSPITTSFSTTTAPVVAAGDFDADGQMDLAVQRSDVSWDPALPSLAVFSGIGDGTFRLSGSYFGDVNYSRARAVVSDFNGDGRPDFVTSFRESDVAVVMAGPGPDLAITQTHTPRLSAGTSGVAYRFTVSNAGTQTTNGIISVVAALPAFLTATEMGGSGWTCNLSLLSCTRQDSLRSGLAFPDVVLTVNIAASATGNATVSAAASGGGDADASNSNSTDTSPILPASTVALSSSMNPAAATQAVSLTATVTAGATGTVTFYDGITVLGTAPIAGGQAVLTTRLPAAGQHSILAVYAGDATFGRSASAILAQVIQPVSNTGFQTPTRSRMGLNAIDCAATADFNGDGKLDLACGVTDQSFVILLGRGDGTFQAPEERLGPIYPFWRVDAADLNGDGKQDLVISGGAAAKLQILLGNGDGTFRSGGAQSGILCVLGVGDFDWDGRADLIVRRTASPGAVLLLSNSDGTFQRPILIDPSDWSSGLTGDFDADGRADILLSTGTSGILLLGGGNGAFRSAIPLSVPSDGFGALLAGDFNQDGKLDVLAMGSGLTSFSVLPGRGDGTFSSPIRSTSPSSLAPASSAVGDFNGDGKLDLAVMLYSDSTLAIFRGNGDGTFQPASYFNVGSNRLAMGDFNGDGRTDIASGLGRTDMIPSGANTGDLFVMLANPPAAVTATITEVNRLVAGQGGASFVIGVRNNSFAPIASNLSMQLTLPAGLTATSLNGYQWTCTLATLLCTRPDGIPPTGSSDITVGLAVSNTVPAGLVTSTATYSWTGDSATTARLSRVFLPSSLNLAVDTAAIVLGQSVRLMATVPVGYTGSILFSDNGSPVTTAVISGTQIAATVPLETAGRHDLRATYSGNATYAPGVSPLALVSVAAKRSIGVGQAVSYPTADNPVAIVSGDFNRDGRLDLAAASSSGTVSVLLGNGDGTFQPKVDYPGAGVTNSLSAADFDGDGITDLVMSTQSALVVLIGNGSGTFKAPTSYAAPQPLLEGVALGDFNSDGIVDAAASALGSMQIFRSEAGSGRAWTKMGDGANESRLLVGDLDHDAWPDLVRSYSGIRGYRGAADGSFTGITGVLSSYAGAAAIGDLNGDGKPDLIVSSTQNAGISIWLGSGNGAFTLSSTAGAPTAYGPLTITDVNGDGNLDVLATNPGANQLALFLGNGDGTVHAPLNYAVGTNPGDLVTGDFNGDGRADVAVANRESNAITVSLGADPPILSITAATQRYLVRGQTGAQYKVTVTNAGLGATTGTVIFTDTLPVGLTATAITGSGWFCTLANLTCSRSDSLLAGSSYSPITITLDVSSSAAAELTNQLSASGGGSPNTVTNHQLTVLSGLFITGQILKDGLPISGVVVTLTGNSSYSTSTDIAGNYYFTSLVSGASYTVTPALAGYRFTPGSISFSGITDGKTANFTAVSRQAKLGIFRSGFWAVDTTGNTAWDAADQYLSLGQAGDVPVVGDFDGDGTADMGIFRGGFWAIDTNHNGVWDATDRYVWLGQAGDVPVVGDFNGDGIAEMGVFRSGFWAIDTNHNGIWDATDQYVWLGGAGDVPIVGDFNGDGTSEMGVFRGGFWAIDMNRNGVWDATDKYVWLGQSGDVPVVVDTNDDGIAEMGVFRSGFWAVDRNSDGIWGSGDGYYWLGQAGDIPVVVF